MWREVRTTHWASGTTLNCPSCSCGGKPVASSAAMAWSAAAAGSLPGGVPDAAEP